MEATTQRQLRPRKKPSATPDPFESDEEVRGRSKRRSTKKPVPPKPEATETSTQKKRKTKGGSVAAGGKKKRTRCVVKGDTGGADMEGEDNDLLQEEEEDETTETDGLGIERAKRVTMARKSQASDAAAELLGDPVDASEAEKEVATYISGKGNRISISW